VVEYLCSKCNALSSSSITPFKKEEIKAFHDEHKQKQFITTKPPLQKILKGMLYTEEEERYTQAQVLGKE
jgi:hypothetical protein